MENAIFLIGVAAVMLSSTDLMIYSTKRVFKPFKALKWYCEKF